MPATPRPRGATTPRATARARIAPAALIGREIVAEPALDFGDRAGRARNPPSQARAASASSRPCTGARRCRRETPAWRGRPRVRHRRERRGRIVEDEQQRARRRGRRGARRSAARVAVAAAVDDEAAVGKSRKPDAGAVAAVERPAAAAASKRRPNNRARPAPTASAICVPEPNPACGGIAAAMRTETASETSRWSAAARVAAATRSFCGPATASIARRRERNVEPGSSRARPRLPKRRPRLPLRSRNPR